MPRRIAIALVLVAVLWSFPGSAQSNIDPDQAFAWGENIGWTNWHPSTSAGVVVGETFLSGYVWCENIGWINVGDGTPANGTSYGNTVGEDSGVNVSSDGDLTGFAWGENVGWINFGGGSTGSLASISGDRIVGHAWGENIGWINLSDATHYVGLDEAGEITNLVCVVAGETVQLAWTNSVAFTSITIERDGVPIATLGGGATSYVDVGPVPGVHSYSVIGNVGPLASDPASCNVVVPAQAAFRRGDCNDDGTTDVSDPIRLLGVLFLQEPPLTCDDACDADDDGDLDIGDSVALLAYLYTGGAAPAAPFPSCGPDPSPDPLGCTPSSVCP